MLNETLHVKRDHYETDRDLADGFCSDTIFPRKSNTVEYVIAYNGAWAYGPRYDFVEDYTTYDSLDEALSELPRAKELLLKHGVTEIGIVELSPKGRRWVMHLRNLTFDTPTNSARLG